MKPNEKIKARRKELGLTDIEVAKLVELSIYEYGDVEQHAHEIFEVVALQEAKKICIALGFVFFELFDMHCAFCVEGKPHTEDLSLLRNELIASRRKKLGLSREELGNRVGFYEVEIENLENNPEHIEAWPIDFIKDLAVIIDVPIQILMDVKCNKCGE